MIHFWNISKTCNVSKTFWKCYKNGMLFNYLQHVLTRFNSWQCTSPLSGFLSAIISFLTTDNKDTNLPNEKSVPDSNTEILEILFGYGVALLEPLYGRSGITHRYTRQHEGDSRLNVRQFMRTNQDLWRHTYNKMKICLMASVTLKHLWTKCMGSIAGKGFWLIDLLPYHRWQVVCGHISEGTHRNNTHLPPQLSTTHPHPYHPAHPPIYLPAIHPDTQPSPKGLHSTSLETSPSPAYILSQWLARYKWALTIPCSANELRTHDPIFLYKGVQNRKKQKCTYSKYLVFIQHSIPVASPGLYWHALLKWVSTQHDTSICPPPDTRILPVTLVSGQPRPTLLPGRPVKG